MPVGRILAIARHRNAEVAGEVSGKTLEVTIEDGFPKQRANAVARATAVWHRGSGPRIQNAKSLPLHRPLLQNFRSIIGARSRRKQDGDLEQLGLGWWLSFGKARGSARCPSSIIPGARLLCSISLFVQ